MKQRIILLILMVVPVLSPAQSTLKAKNLLVVTIDGLRWQEVFRGADPRLINDSSQAGNISVTKEKYWNNLTLERRNLLMPFFWNTIAVKGQVHGNRDNGSLVNVTNPYWFSYPGYSEIWTGYADPAVNSNELGPNPNSNVLEYMIAVQPALKGKIAAFASWGPLNDILNETRSQILVNAGYERMPEELLGPGMEALNQIQFELPDLFGGIRLDGATFQLGFNYLKAHRPRILYLSFDETDDLAHGGKYDLYLNSTRYTDGFLQQLWEWIQSDPQYKDQTTLFVTCDHGRGEGTKGWHDHGTSTPHSGETWFAVIGPDTPATGESKAGQYYNNQFAATLSALMGIPYISDKPVGKPILQVLGQ
jgi:hypothetical protein